MELAKEQSIDVQKAIARQTIGDLYEKYQEVCAKGKTDMLEEAVKIRFIEPLLEAFGWNVRGLDEVEPEQRTLSGRTDFALHLGRDGIPKIFFEIKRLSEDLNGYRIVRGKRQTYEEQVINDAWQMRVHFAVLTNYKELRFYYTHVRKPSDGLILKVTCDRYLDDDVFERLWVLSKPSVQMGLLEREVRRRTRADVNIEILKDLFKGRQLLANDIMQSNGLTLDETRESVQRILNRLVVIRVAEDRGVISSDSLSKMVDAWEQTVIDKSIRTLMRDLRNMFRDFDAVYNSKLFEEHPCEELKISNEVLISIIHSLYKYNFDLIDADILGVMYEDYLGHVLLEEGGEVEISEAFLKRQEGGIYYTPPYVVDYIIFRALGTKLQELWKTVENYLDQRDLKKAREAMNAFLKLRVLDPACGSASFLIKAYDFFASYYVKYNERIKQLIGKGDLSQYGFLISDYPQLILTNNLFGVDIDPQACEVGGVNCMLKVLRKGERLPSILQENIKLGNSLVFGDNERLKSLIGEDWQSYRPFNWHAEFKMIMDNGGFDVVVGNPPWGSEVFFPKKFIESTYELAEGQYDSFEIFIELSRFILKRNGVWGFIVPHTIFKPEHERLRKYLLENFTIDTIIRCGEGFFDSVFMATAIIIFKNEKPSPDHRVRCTTLTKEDRTFVQERRGSLGIEELEAKKMHFIPQSRLLKNKGFEFDIYLQQDEYEMIQEWERNIINWKNITTTGRGVELTGAGNVMQCPNCFKWDTLPKKKKGGGYYSKTCTHCSHTYTVEESTQRTTVVRESHQDQSDKPFVIGEDVNRYYLVSKRFIDTTKDGINYKEPSLYKGKKLLVRKTGVGIYATIDEKNHYCNQAVFIWKLKPKIDMKLEYILGILSSRLMLFYYYKKTGIVEWQSYPYITQKVIQTFPIKQIDFENLEQRTIHNEIVRKVRQLLENSPPVNQRVDFELESLVMKLYKVKPTQRQHILNGLKRVQSLRIIREMFAEEFGVE